MYISLFITTATKNVFFFLMELFLRPIHSKSHNVCGSVQPFIRVFIIMYEPLGARGGTGCSPIIAQSSLSVGPLLPWMDQTQGEGGTSYNNVVMAL